ncbi:tol-pal system YbgF family protein [Thermodesulfobacteriota bacterium]
MKKIIAIFVISIFFTGINLCYAQNNTLEKNSNKPSYQEMREREFFAWFKTTEDPGKYISIEKSINSLRVIKEYFWKWGFDVKYKNDEIIYDKLKPTLKDILEKIENPKTAKDYFYKGLFSYPKPPAKEVPEMFEHFQYVIDNFPDTVYAKLSYYLLADNYSLAGHYNDAKDIMKQYIEKYGEEEEFKDEIALQNKRIRAAKERKRREIEKKLVGRSPLDKLMTPLHEDNFILQYEIATDEDPSSDAAFIAFSKMRSIYNTNNLGRKYTKNLIESEELRKIIKGILDSIENPKTAKDYFYKAIFIQSKDNIKYVIDNFPDSNYVKYSMLLLAHNYESPGNRNKSADFQKAVNLYKEFINKYGATAGLYNILIKLYTFKPIVKGADMKKQEAPALEYFNKLEKEYPAEKELIGDSLVKLAWFYKADLKDKDRALKYSLRVFNEPGYAMRSVRSAATGIMHIYKSRKEYQKVEEILSKIKERYYNVKNFRNLYGDFKRQLEEIKLFGFDEVNYAKEFRGVQTYESPPLEINDKVEKWRKEEWPKIFEEDWSEPYTPEEEWRIRQKEIGRKKKLTSLLDVDIYEAPPISFLYSNLNYDHDYFYEDQPIKLKVTFKGDVKLDRNDWYNMLEFSAQPKKYLFYFDNNGNRVELKGYKKEREFIEEDEISLRYNLLKGEDLKDGKSDKEKTAIVEVFDKDYNSLDGNYSYRFSVKLILGSNESPETYDVIVPRTSAQINDWTVRKGGLAVKEKKYKFAINYYLEVLGKEKDNPRIRKILFSKLADTYELDKDYQNAKKYLAELLKTIEEDIKTAEDKTKLEEEKVQILQKLKELDEKLKASP